MLCGLFEDHVYSNIEWNTCQVDLDSWTFGRVRGVEGNPCSGNFNNVFLHHGAVHRGGIATVCIIPRLRMIPHPVLADDGCPILAGLAKDLVVQI